MAFSDLSYGWRESSFELRDVRVFNVAELQQIDSKDKWLAYVSLDASDEKSKELLRYNYPCRWLRAKLTINDTYKKLFLGVPEDRKTASVFSWPTLGYIDLEIKEAPNVPFGEKEPREPDILGRLYYSEANEYFGEHVSACFDVPKALFDYIEKIVNQPNSTLTAGIKMKCWYWIGPIGDSQIYLAKERKVFPVYLTKLMADTHILRISHIDHDAEVPEVKLSTVVDRIAALQAQAESIKISAWITAVAAVFLALLVMLR